MEVLDIAKKRLLAVHKLGKLALDINNHQTAFFNINHNDNNI